MVRVAVSGLFFLAVARAQTCASVPTFTSCDFVFEADAADLAAHPNPYLTATLHGEFRSPKHRTVLAHGFWDGGRSFVIRFTPTDPGSWDFRVTSNLASLNGKTAAFAASDSESEGFLKPDNVHAWSYADKRSPHLWMGDTCFTFPWIDRAVFDRLAETRAKQKFNHMRGMILHPNESLRKAYLSPDQPNIEHFRELDSRIVALNKKDIFVDLVLAGGRDHLTRMFPTRDQRERFIKYVASRYSPMMITWQGVLDFEEYSNGRDLLNEIGGYLMKYDQYKHPRSTHAQVTSAPLLADGWMTYAVYSTAASSVGAVERQITGAPLVNVGFAAEPAGAADSDAFRKALWNTTINGMFPGFANTGTDGAGAIAVDPKHFESPGAKAMTAWYDFFEDTRFWELEPFFEVEGGRGLSLGGVEYIVYIEKPGAVSVVVERKKYDVYWFRPSDGETIHEKKDFKGDKFEGSPPDDKSDWVLHLSRDGRKNRMLKSWKFESRPVIRQDVERVPGKIPFIVQSPAEDTIPAGKPVDFISKLTRETKASKAMQYVWTVEATAGAQGYRVIGATQSGRFTIPKSLATSYPAVVNLRLYGINGNGKVYALDRVIRVE